MYCACRYCLDNSVFSAEHTDNQSQSCSESKSAGIRFVKPECVLVWDAFVTKSDGSVCDVYDLNT